MQVSSKRSQSGSRTNGHQPKSQPVIVPVPPDCSPQLYQANPADSLAPPVHDRVAIFIDGSNLFYAALHLELEIDYAKLLCYLTGNRRLLRAYFYTGVDRTNEKQQGFLLWMRRNGYRVVAKELVPSPDGTKRANLDVEIAVDMMTLASHCDTMILLSGDGDLTYAVNTVAYLGVQVELVSLQSMTSESLINVADRYTDLATIRAAIQKKRV